MLFPDYLQRFPEQLRGQIQKLEEDITTDIARRLAKDFKKVETAGYQANILQEMGFGKTQITESVSKKLGFLPKQVENLLAESTWLSWVNDKAAYAAGGKDLNKMSGSMLNMYEGINRQTKGSMKDITKSLGIATGKGNKNLDQFYKDTLDYGVIKLNSGAFDYNTVVKEAIKELTNSGIRAIDYKSGTSTHLDVAVNRAIRTASTQITGHMAMANAEDMDQDLMELTAHADARPEHEEWQGQIVSLGGKHRKYLTTQDIGYGSGDGFQGWNCRHDWFPYFEGISQPAARPAYKEPIEYNGRQYTAYEASQQQRSIERAMRKSKREIAGFKGAGLDSEATAAQVKLKRQQQEYDKFSNAAGIRAKYERARVAGEKLPVNFKELREMNKRQVPFKPVYKTTKEAFKLVKWNNIDTGYTKVLDNELLTIVNRFPLDTSRLTVKSLADRSAFGYQSIGLTSKYGEITLNYDMIYSNIYHKTEEQSIRHHLLNYQSRLSPLRNNDKAHLATIWHEYAHVIDTEYKFKILPQFEKDWWGLDGAMVTRDNINLAKRLGPILNDSRDTLSNLIYNEMAKVNGVTSKQFNDLVKYELGNYAASNKAEFLAEAFAVTNLTKQEVKGEFLQLFDKIFNREFDKVLRIGGSK